MAKHPRSVDEAIARFDDLVARIDGKPQATGRPPLRKSSRTSARTMAKRARNIIVALAALLVATIGYGLLVGPIGIGGLFLVLLLAVALFVVFSKLPAEREPKRVEYSEDLPTKTVVQQFDSLLSRRRGALPAPAARHADAIAQQLPLLESRLGEVDALDPLAQDARRLLGKHLPDLLDRYERVPAQYRSTERDGEGLTVDQRLTAGLDAAKEALDEIGAKLARSDLDAFETQGRFIESRYKDGGVSEGS
jgi:hypothetical protein